MATHIIKTLCKVRLLIKKWSHHCVLVVILGAQNHKWKVPAETSKSWNYAKTAVSSSNVILSFQLILLQYGPLTQQGQATECKIQYIRLSKAQLTKPRNQNKILPPNPNQNSPVVRPPTKISDPLLQKVQDDFGKSQPWRRSKMASSCLISFLTRNLCQKHQWWLAAIINQYTHPFLSDRIETTTKIKEKDSKE